MATKTKPEPTPIAEQLPAAGGSYIRDDATGEIVLADEPTKPADAQLGPVPGGESK